jgi:Asp-tRNA(Asn)/Glu-tRNA(Gln) amidotransferase A subunit family amidase
MTDLTNLTVAQIRDGHRAGDFSAVEVAEAFNANVAGAKALNAFIVETPEHALSAAKQADADRSAGMLKPLSGVPIGMKDLFATNGVQTTAASHMLEGFVPRYESTVSQKLWGAGAFASTSSRRLPPVSGSASTTSSRSRSLFGITAVIGSTPVTSTSPSCSTQPKMPFNSPSIAAASASLIAMRASDAIFLTVA